MKKVLIVVDMQNDFIDGALGTREAVEIVDNVVNKINSFEGDIYVTYDNHKENYLETREGRFLPVSHCIEGTDGWQICKKVREALEKANLERKLEAICSIYKPSFGSTELVACLSAYNEKDTEVTLIGLCTDICVVSNALLLKNYYPEMDIKVDASCCAGVTPESHKAALLTMKMCQIVIENE